MRVERLRIQQSMLRMGWSDMAPVTSPKDLLRLHIRWKKLAPGRWEARVTETVCTLTMNDFPEEPLYTVRVAGQSLDLDDAPAC